MTRPNEQARDEAAARFARARRGRDEGARDDLDAWLAADADNRDAFRELSTLWRDLEAAKADPDMLAMREEATAALNTTRGVRFGFGALAATLVLMLSGVLLFGLYTLIGDYMGRQAVETRDYATRAGQMAEITLSDGSEVTLDADSAIRVAFSDEERHIDLRRGRAFFKVAKNPALRFVVQSGERSVTALGTQFAVDLRPTSLTVTLTEGKVRFREQRAGNAQEASIDMNAGYALVAQGEAVTLSRIDPRAATGWLNGRLVFDDATLGEIASELGRYSRKPIRIDPALRDKRMSAILPASNPAAFLASAEALGLGKGRVAEDGFHLSDTNSKKIAISR